MPGMRTLALAGILAVPLVPYVDGARERDHVRGATRAARSQTLPDLRIVAE